MKIYFDYDDEDGRDLMEIQLSEDEIKKLMSFEPIEKDVSNELISDDEESRPLNVYIRRIAYGKRKDSGSNEASG